MTIPLQLKRLKKLTEKPKKVKKIKVKRTKPLTLAEKVVRWRRGGEGFIRWCEENVCVAVHLDDNPIPTWIPMSELPDTINPETGRSYKSMWEGQKDIVREALRMKDGRFVHRLIVLCWQRGDGKCQKIDSPILMYDGSIKKCQDIVVGDLLMGDDNTPRQVLSLASGKEEMFEVVPYHGEPLTVTKDHYLTLKQRVGHRPKTGKSYEGEDHFKTFDMKLSDFMEQSEYFKRKSMLFRVPIDWPKQEVPIDPYFLGVWLGDGHAHHPTITNSDPEVIEKIYEFAESQNVNVTIKSYTDRNTASYALVTPAGQPNPVLNLFREHDLINNKHIPEIYKINDRETRMQLLAGIIDTDGTRNRNSIDITQKSKKMIEDIAFIARSLGFHAHVKEIQKSIKSIGFVGTYYSVAISGDCSQIPLRVPRKQCAPRSTFKNILTTGIKEIKSVGEQEYYGFNLDGNGRYVTGDFTVTHNSFLACLVQLWKFFCFPRQTIVLGANSKDQVKFVHYDIMREIIQNSPNLLAAVGERNIQEKQIALRNSKGNIISLIRSISSFSGIVSNITGYTFSEIFDMKNPKFFVQLDGSTRNIPNALGVIDSTVSAKTHVLYKLYQNSLEGSEDNLTFFSYRCSPEGEHTDFLNPQMTQAQLDDYRMKFPPAEFDRYFKNVWDSGIDKVFPENAIDATRILSVTPNGKPAPNTKNIQSFLAEYKKLNEHAESDDPFLIDKHESRAIEVAEFTRHVKYVKDIVRLDHSSVFNNIATIDELRALTAYYDTEWCVGVGVDRADPLKTNTDWGARTIVSVIAKGLPGSLSQRFADYSPEAINSYLYVVLCLAHIEDSSLDGIKEIIQQAHISYEGVDTIASERWGMFDITTWLEENDIKFELFQPTAERQKTAFTEFYMSVVAERFKMPPIGLHGHKTEDLYKEEMLTFEQSPDRVWYGSPEKSERFGIQDDSMFAIAWGLYGMRNLTHIDFRSRGVASFAGMYYEDRTVLGKYT